MGVISNLADRMRVLRILVSRRYIWRDLAEMACFDHVIRDLRANTNPLMFSRILRVTDTVVPNFAETLGEESDFDLPGAPELHHSETSVSEFLGELVFRLRASAVLELGCFLGWTSAHFALGLHAAGTHGKLWCVDTKAQFLEHARTNLARLGLDQPVEFLCGSSTDKTILDQLPSEIDIVFIDTSHTYETTRKEIETYSLMLSPGGYMILHDSISFPGVRRAISEVCDKFYCLTFATERSNGLTILWRKT